MEAGLKSVRTASGKLRKDVELLKEEIQNEQRNETRKELEELNKIAYEFQTANGKGRATAHGN